MAAHAPRSTSVACTQPAVRGVRLQADLATPAEPDVQQL